VLVSEKLAEKILFFSPISMFTVTVRLYATVVVLQAGFYSVLIFLSKQGIYNIIGERVSDTK
jgi:hypothetical protein